MSNYDQWRTASPYDDEPDIIQEAGKFLAAYAGEEIEPERIGPWAVFIITGLMDILEDEGLT